MQASVTKYVHTRYVVHNISRSQTFLLQVVDMARQKI